MLHRVDRGGQVFEFLFGQRGSALEEPDSLRGAPGHLGLAPERLAKPLEVAALELERVQRVERLTMIWAGLEDAAVEATRSRAVIQSMLRDPSGVHRHFRLQIGVEHLGSELLEHVCERFVLRGSLGETFEIREHVAKIVLGGALSHRRRHQREGLLGVLEAHVRDLRRSTDRSHALEGIVAPAQHLEREDEVAMARGHLVVGRQDPRGFDSALGRVIGDDLLERSDGPLVLWGDPENLPIEIDGPEGVPRVDAHELRHLELAESFAFEVCALELHLADLEKIVPHRALLVETREGLEGLFVGTEAR